ncbi:MAG: glycosyltransferase [Syntrophobacteraceae bacterium]
MISLIIPARNEEAHLGETLAYLRRYTSSDCAEIIVTEGGSTDCTVDIALPLATVIHGADCTRAGLMNAGARVPRGDVLFFLHADSLPPLDFAALIGLSMRSEVGEDDENGSFF